MHPAILLATLLIAGGACAHGTRPSVFPPAHSPVGAQVRYWLEGDRWGRSAELFAVDSVGVYVRDSVLTRVSWSSIISLEVRQLNERFRVRAHTVRGPEVQGRLALVSRFPQGLSGPLLSQVLATLGQAQLVERE